MDACPAESTKRSRLGQTGSCGSKRRNSCHSVYATGAMPMGVPGCPESAAWIASMAKVRMVLMLVKSMFCFTGVRGGAVAMLIQYPFTLPFASRPLLLARKSGGRGGGRRPPGHASPDHSDRCGHLHPVISGLSMPFL